MPRTSIIIPAQDGTFRIFYTLTRRRVGALIPCHNRQEIQRHHSGGEVWSQDALLHISNLASYEEFCQSISRSIWTIDGKPNIFCHRHCKLSGTAILKHMDDRAWTVKVESGNWITAVHLMMKEEWWLEYIFGRFCCALSEAEQAPIDGCMTKTTNRRYLIQEYHQGNLYGKFKRTRDSIGRKIIRAYHRLR